MPYIDKDKRYTVAVVAVTDGDTVTVEFADGERYTVRVLGIDTPEKPRFQRYERPAEWAGIESLEILGTWGDRATAAGRHLLGVTGETAGETDDQGRPKVTLFFDPNADLFDPFGRLLGYIEQGTTLYNRQMVERGYARAYASGFARYDEFANAERRARANGRGLWANSTPGDTPAIRNDGVDDLFIPHPVPVTVTSGSDSPPNRAVAVRAAHTAVRPTANTDDGDSNAPLIGVDRRANVVLVGGLIISETYERAEGYDVSTASYGNFPVLTNLLTNTGEKDGDVAINGGHGQYGADYALSLEDTAYYRRYLEGVDLALHQYNDLPTAPLREYQAVIVTPPADAYTEADIAALRTFTERGGVVVLMGSGMAPDAPRGRLNALAGHLGTNLRFSEATLIDPENNVNGDEQVITTTWFNGRFDAFGPYPTGD